MTGSPPDAVDWNSNMTALLIIASTLWLGDLNSGADAFQLVWRGYHTSGLGYRPPTFHWSGGSELDPEADDAGLEQPLVGSRMARVNRTAMTCDFLIERSACFAQEIGVISGVDVL